MNLTKLFETQAKLDEHIMQQHPELRGQNNLDWKLLALQVELGECANEWRGFKKWSKDQEPRTVERLTSYYAAQQGLTRNPLLEEYVDCLHFILSIGIETELDCRHNSLIREENIVEDGEPTLYLFAEVLGFASELFWNCYHDEYEQREGIYKALFTNFVQLGKSLGLTWEQIEKAYFEKNAVNHARQDSGY